MSALNLIYKDRMSFGVELPLDRDWSEAGQRRARTEGRPFGVPDITNPERGVELAECLGFDAVWLRDVPVHDPSFGDAGQVFDPFPYLGFLAGRTRRIALGTAGIVLPLRDPILLSKMTASLHHLSGGRFVLGIASGTARWNTRLWGSATRLAGPPCAIASNRCAPSGQGMR